MNKRSIRTLAVLFAAAFLAGTAVQLYAFHQWGCYHWAWPTANSRLDLGYAYGRVLTDRDYAGAFVRARDAWNTAPPLNVFQVSSGNQLTWYARKYGFNGWLGLATIYINGCIINKGTSKLNDSYLQFSSYSQTNIDHVACQEVGHTFGLDHDRTRADTCMNDTVLTAGAQISQHDKDEIRTIYPAQ